MKHHNFALALMVALCITLIFGCETILTSTTPKRDIKERAEAKYIPDYSFTPSASSSTPSGYTVGIIDMVVNEDVPVGWVTVGLDSFNNAYFKGLESILLSKGVPVKGPFDYTQK